MVLEQLLQSDLSVNASRYDWMRAASNPLYSSVVWSTWILTSGIASLAGITILAGILSSSTARRDTFNQYIIGLVICPLFQRLQCLLCTEFARFNVLRRNSMVCVAVVLCRLRLLWERLDAGTDCK